MKYSEALQALRETEQEIAELQTVLHWRQLDLADAECDHPDTSGHVCDHCGAYDDNPNSHEYDDIFRVLMADVADFRASGLPNLSAYDSPYSYR